MKNIHDKFVKEQLLDKRNAVDFLRISLPQEVLQYLDLDYLEPTQNSFISEDIQELFSDIVYQCKMKAGDEVFCNILIEHKSYRDPMAAFKIGSYVFKGYLQQIKNKSRFRVIIPLIFYHHEKTWKFKPVESYFDNFPTTLRRFVPLFETIFFDVNNLSDNAILDIRNTALTTMFLTQKHHHNPEELLNIPLRIWCSPNSSGIILKIN